MTDVSRLKKATEGAIAALFASNPFLGILLKKTWVLYDPSAPEIAYTDGLRIYLGSKVQELEEPMLRVVLIHELMHIVLKHVPRAQKIQKRIPLDAWTLNVLADAIVNEYVKDVASHKFMRGLTTWELELLDLQKLRDILRVPLSRKKSFEELAYSIYRRGLDRLQKLKERKEGRGRRRSRELKPTIPDDIWYSTEKEHKAELVVIHAGSDEEGPGSKLTPVETEKILKGKVAMAMAVVKRTAGVLPGWAERIVGEVLQPVVDWRGVVRERLRAFIGDSSKPSWAKINKKYPYVRPGQVCQTRPTVLALVDTSGSISEEELQRFVSEVVAIARQLNAEVVAIPFDAAAYPPLRIRSALAVRDIKIRGGGGTKIYPALKAAEKFMRPHTKIVIFSDWEIYDLDDSNVRQWLRQYRHQIIAVTVDREPPKYLPHRIKLWLYH